MALIFLTVNSASVHQAAAKNFGRLLGDIAREKGIAQKSISKATGIRETTISRIFTGKFCAKSDYLFALAYAVGVDIIYSCDCG